MGGQFIYDPIGKRDPFRILHLQRQIDEPRGRRRRRPAREVRPEPDRPWPAWSGSGDRTPRPRVGPVGTGLRRLRRVTAIGKNQGQILGDRRQQTSLVREAYVDFHGEQTEKGDRVAYSAEPGRVSSMFALPTQQDSRSGADRIMAVILFDRGDGSRARRRPATQECQRVRRCPTYTVTAESDGGRHGRDVCRGPRAQWTSRSFQEDGPGPRRGEPVAGRGCPGPLQGRSPVQDGTVEAVTDEPWMISESGPTATRIEIALETRWRTTSWFLIDDRFELRHRGARRAGDEPRGLAR